MIFENVENQNNLNWKSESLFLLILGKIGNLYFNRMFFYFFMTIYYGDHLLLSDEERVSKQSNPINTENLEQSFRLHLDDRDGLIQKFELFIQENWNSSLLPNMDDSLFCQFTNNILSKNIYSKSKTSKTKNLFTVQNELRDIISQTIDILYPLYIAYIAYNVKNIPINNTDGYCQNIIHDFHYVSCDIFVKQSKNNQNLEHDNLDEADFLFGNFVYHNGLYVLNDISIKYNGLLYLKDLNINKSFYEHFDDKNGTSKFFIDVIDNNNQIFKHNLSYSPHYIYKQIRLIIQDIYMTSCLNKYNKKLCCAVIHQIFDDFCGKELVNSLINEIRPYETLLKSEELDGIVYDNFTQHFQSKLLLTSTEINQIIEKINLHDQDYWRCFGNMKHDFLITDIFKKLSENNYVKDYVFSLLEKLLLDNDFTLLEKHYFSCKNYQFNQFIKPFAEYTKNELNDLIQNNPIFFISDWIDINHPNVYLKQIVNNFYTVNDLMKLNLSYSDLWQKLTNIKINFYQQKKHILFGLKHSNEINSENQDKLLDSINYLKLLEKHHIKIHEYIDIDFNLLYQKYNNKDYDQNYFDKLTTKSFNQEIIPPIDSLNGISAYQFFKVIHSFFNSEKNNINTNYRKRQQRYNSRLENYKHQMVNDIIDHFTTDNEYGQYTKYSFYNSENSEVFNKLTLVFEDLNYINLGRTKDDKRQINLIKGVLTLLEEKIKLYHLPIEIKYVNPAYTSQSCPSCYYVDRKNRNSRQDDFRCLHCGFTANEDVRYRELTGVVQRAEAITLPSKDDFIAACNIAERLSVLPNSTKLHQRKIKDLLMEKHEQVKGSCKMFNH